MEPVTSGGDEPISVADLKLRNTRVLSRQCETCIFRPGNPMMLQPGRLRDLVNEALSTQRFIVCHDTLPYGAHPGYGPAVCRGFYDRYDTQALQLARRLWGIVEVPPPAATSLSQHQPHYQRRPGCGGQAIDRRGTQTLGRGNPTEEG